MLKTFTKSCWREINKKFISVTVLMLGTKHSCDETFKKNVRYVKYDTFS